MNIVRNKVFVAHLESFIRRTFTKSVSATAPRGYDGDGKTTLLIMNKDEDYGLMVDGYSEAGFKLNNNLTVLGPMILFPRSVLAWNVASIADVNEDSLSLFKILEPKIDILVLGTGDKIQNHNFFKEFIKFSKDYKIQFEILPTDVACPTFNFLNAEGRNVVGAFIPPQTVKYNEDDEVKTRLRYQGLFKLDE